MVKVSVITPSTPDRLQFNGNIEMIIMEQDYEGDVEHLWDYTGGTIGNKRNALCELAKGDIILHADSDDFYSPQWIRKSVAKLQEGYDIVGLKQAYFYDEANKLGKLYEYKGKQGYCLGATMCYWKKTWERNKFNETVRHGEDSLFLANAGYVGNHDYIDGFTAMIHGNNTASHIAFKGMPITNLHNIPYVKSRGI